MPDAAGISGSDVGPRVAVELLACTARFVVTVVIRAPRSRSLIARSSSSLVLGPLDEGGIGSLAAATGAAACVFLGPHTLEESEGLGLVERGALPEFPAETAGFLPHTFDEAPDTALDPVTSLEVPGS